MNRFHRTVFLCVTVLIAIASGSSLEASPGFVENRGQIDSRARYYFTGPRAGVYFTQDAVVIDLKEKAVGHRLADLNETDPSSVEVGTTDSMAWAGCAVYIRFEGANPSPQIDARGELVTKHNYFVSGDRSTWRANVPSYEEIAYRGIWPGIDLVFRRRGDDLEYEVIRAARADTAQVRFRYEGADRVAYAPGGTLLVEASAGPSICLRPSGAGGGRWSLTDEGDVMGAAASPAPLNNPSALIWSTYLGDANRDIALDVVLDDVGRPNVAGWTYGPSFPTTPGAYDESQNGSRDAYISKFSASGDSLLWSTYFGGAGDDAVTCIVLDATENPVVAGWTTGIIPTTPTAYDTTQNGGHDVFVAKFSSAGDSLLWSTYLGGSADDGYVYPYVGQYFLRAGLALDALGDAVIVGSTQSSDFPSTPGSYDESFQGRWSDGFVAKISSDGSQLRWSTALGGIGQDYAWAVAVNSQGSPIVTGATSSSDFPVTAGAYDTTHSALIDAFVTAFTAEGDSLLWSTYLGGAGEDAGYDMALDASGDPIITGYTEGDFPTTPGAYDETYNDGGRSPFVTKILAGGGSLGFSTYLSGSADGYGYAVSVTSSGNVIVAGYNYPCDFPTTPGSFDESCNGGWDAFVAELSASGSDLLWGSYLGGSGHEYCYGPGGMAPCGLGMTVDSEGNPVVAGATRSFDFPTTPASYDTSFNGNFDAFVTKLDVAGVASLPASPEAAPGVGLACPNPFEASTRITLELATRARVNLTVYDVQGRRIQQVLDSVLPPGSHAVAWDGRSDSGQLQPPGVYFYEIRSGASRAFRKIVLVR